MVSVEEARQATEDGYTKRTEETLRSVFSSIERKAAQGKTKLFTTNIAREVKTVRERVVHSLKQAGYTVRYCPADPEVFRDPDGHVIDWTPVKPRGPSLWQRLKRKFNGSA